ncbi:MAG: rRNA pseudouridine synthase [Clostridiaceae bacterium]|nr:rRNA pseudouridine synthase [Clostridiaceae bacterium]
MPRLRLDKFLRDQGIATRSEIKTCIKKGFVQVNGSIVKDPGFHIDTDRDRIIFDGKEVTYKEFVYYMLNKPKGVITATHDTKAKTVLDFFPEDIRLRNVFPVGRLDKDTEGFLLITDDGILAHNLLAPKKRVEKLYEAKLDKYPSEDAVKIFSEGVVLDDGYKTLPAALELLPAKDEIIARVRIYEGKYHQVKRMFKAVGANVVSLKRLSMGGIKLDETLKPGEYRELTEKEISILKGNP